MEKDTSGMNRRVFIGSILSTGLGVGGKISPGFKVGQGLMHLRNVSIGVMATDTKLWERINGNKEEILSRYEYLLKKQKGGNELLSRVGSHPDFFSIDIDASDGEMDQEIILYCDFENIDTGKIPHLSIQITQKNNEITTWMSIDKDGKYEFGDDDWISPEKKISLENLMHYWERGFEGFYDEIFENCPELKSEFENYKRIRKNVSDSISFYLGSTFLTPHTDFQEGYKKDIEKILDMCAGKEKDSK